MIFTEFFGLGGKIGINCFLLITGYFMCMQEFKLSKLIKLYLQVKIYAFGIALIFWVSGYELFSFKEGFKVFFDIAYEMNNGFVTAFLALYVITPFLNILIHHMERWRHLLLISVLVSIYTITSTFFFNSHFEYLPWYCNMYLIGAYLRMYPSEWMSTKKPVILFATFNFILIWASILVFTYKHRFHIYYLVNDSNKLLALTCSISLFLLFKIMPMGYHPWINKLAASTLGVLCIHASSDTMRKWLWGDVLHNVDMYTNPWLSVHAILSVIGIWCVCTLIDQIRLNCIEPPIMRIIDSHFVPWVSKKMTIISNALGKQAVKANKLSRD